MQRRGTRIRGRFLTLFVLPNQLDVTRLGIVATRRLGGATQRNRAKRLVREIFRHHTHKMIGPGLDVVVMPRAGFCEIPYDSLESDYVATLRRHARP